MDLIINLFFWGLLISLGLFVFQLVMGLVFGVIGIFIAGIIGIYTWIKGE